MEFLEIIQNCLEIFGIFIRFLDFSIRFMPEIFPKVYEIFSSDTPLGPNHLDDTCNTVMTMWKLGSINQGRTLVIFPFVTNCKVGTCNFRCNLFSPKFSINQVDPGPGPSRGRAGPGAIFWSGARMFKGAARRRNPWASGLMRFGLIY